MRKWRRERRQKHLLAIRKKEMDHYYNRHQEALAVRREWRKKHPRLLRRQKLRYYLKNRTRVLQKQKEWRKRNADKLRAARKRWYEKNKVEIMKQRKGYQKKNLLAYKVYKQNSWARKAGAKVEKISLDQMRLRWKAFGGRCAYCGESEAKTVDHVQPLATGGPHRLNNMVPCCKRCNPSKKRSEWRSWYRKQNFYSPTQEKKIAAFLRETTR
jgi:hypothetical protein